MPFERFFGELPPYARLATAVVPFLAALIARLLFGKNRVTRMLLSLATAWFLISTLMAPYSLNFRREILNLHRIF